MAFENELKYLDNRRSTFCIVYKISVCMYIGGHGLHYRDIIFYNTSSVEQFLVTKALKGHCLIFLSAIFQLFIEYFNIK